MTPTTDFAMSAPESTSDSSTLALLESESDSLPVGFSIGTATVVATCINKCHKVTVYTHKIFIIILLKLPLVLLLPCLVDSENVAVGLVDITSESGLVNTGMKQGVSLLAIT